ncbi:MAG: metal-dependent hydrolase [Desulfovibrio sp.]
MDPVTHLSAGAVIFQAVRHRLPQARLLLPLCLLLSVLPDADVLFFPSDPAFYLLHHRGFTHSVFFVALASPLFALCYARPAGRPGFGILAGLCAALLTTHIYQDLATSYGTQIFAPLSHARLSFDAVFIIDPVYTGLTIAAVLIAAFWKPRRQSIALITLVWIFLYPQACAGLRNVAENRYSESLAAQNAPYQCLTVTTDILSPLFWKAILVNDDRYALESIDMLDYATDAPDFAYLRPSRELLTLLKAADPFLETYFWFTAYPYYMERLTEDGGRELVFGDLRFQSPGPLLRKLFENGRSPFALTVRLKASGQVSDFVFHRGGKTFARTLME